MPARPNRPRFQYSLKTLLLVMTGCALASAVGKWIGLEATLAFLAGSPHGLFWTWVWLSRRFAPLSLRLYSHERFDQIYLSITWTAICFCIVLSTFGFGFGVIGIVRGGFSIPIIHSVTNILMRAASFEMMCVVASFIFILSVVGVASPIAGVCSFLLRKLPISDRYETHATRLIASLSGAVIFLTIAAILWFVGEKRKCLDWMNLPRPVKLTLLFGTFCVALPPFFLWWADRRTRDKGQSETTVSRETS